MVKKEVMDEYKNNHDIDAVISDLKNFDSYSGYQFLLKEIVDYIDFVEELIKEN